MTDIEVFLELFSKQSYVAVRFYYHAAVIDLKNLCFVFKKWVELIHGEVMLVDFEKIVHLSGREPDYNCFGHWIEERLLLY